MNFHSNSKMLEYVRNVFGPKSFITWYHYPPSNINFINVPLNNAILAMRTNSTVSYCLISLLYFIFETKLGKVSIVCSAFLDFNVILKKFLLKYLIFLKSLIQIRILHHEP